MTVGAAVDERAGRARNGDLVVFAANGFAIASWMARVPDVKTRLDLSPGRLGVLLLAISAGAVIGLPLAGRVAHRLGATRTVRCGAAVGLPGLAFAALAVDARAAMPVVMIGLFLFGIGNGLWDVAQNLEGTHVERAIGRAIMPWFHAAFSLGTVLGALVGAAATAARVPVGVDLTLVAVVDAGCALWGTRRFLGAREEVDRPVAVRRVRSPWTEPRTLLIGVMVLAAAFAEGTANDWMAVAFVDGHDLTAALGVLALAVFLCFMTLGRILGTGLLDRYGRVAVLRILFLAAALGCLVVVLGGPWAAFAGAAIWGVGASLGFPVGMSAAADDPTRAAQRISAVATIGYGAFLGGPPFLGFVGDHVGVLHALLAVGVTSVIALAVVPVARPPRATES